MTIGAAAVVASLPATAATNPYQLGPDPTTSSVAATYGPFATAQTTVPAGNGFNGGFIYYPTDTSHIYGGVAIVPGYTALFANEEAWMGPRLASFGFVVIGVETNSRNDYDTARGAQLLAALDYLTQRSSVRTRVDPNRLSVIGHSMGGGGALVAATNRPSLKAAVGLAPYMPSGNMSRIQVPTMVIAGQNDTVVTPSYLDGLYPTLPSTVPGAFVQIAGVDHLFATRPNTVEMRTLLPWLKIFVDNDTRYTQFLCPALKDTSGVSRYSARCGLIPTPSTTTPPVTTTTTVSTPPTTTTTPPVGTTTTIGGSPSSTTTAPPAGGCSATYRTTSTWPGGYQGEVTVTAAGAAVSGWTVRWTLGPGESISSLWNGTLSTSGSAVTVTNAPYNGALAAAGSTSLGFIGSGTPSSPSPSCTAS
jgi:Cellulose binding domain/Dienelactone hydrolase family